jgi:hypothetical protein
MQPMTDERDVPAEITLTGDTLAALMADPALAAELDRVRDEQGRAAMLNWLDAHGLRWRAGGSDPVTALANAATFGGLEFDDVPVSGFGPALELLDQPEGRDDLAAQRRKAARKAQRKARKATRRR